MSQKKKAHNQMDTLNGEKQKPYLQQCKIHSHYESNILYLSNDTSDHQICFKCLQLDKQKYHIDYVVLIQDIINSTSNGIITNFPPLQDQKIHEFLSSHLYKLPNLTDKKIEKIHEYFETLRTQINDQLKKVQIRVEEQIEFLQLNKRKLIDTYNEIASKEELKKLFCDQSEDYSQKIKEFIKSKFEGIQTNTEKIQSAILNFEQIYENISFDQPNIISTQIIDLIQSIEFSSNNILNMNQQRTTNTEIIYDLISSKTNYCTKEFTEEVKLLLSGHSSILNKSSFKSQINEQANRSVFQSQSNKELENIRILSEKILEINKQYQREDENKIISKIQKNSANILKIFFEEQKEIQILFRKYPIFDTLDFSQYFKLVTSNCSSAEDLKIQCTNEGIELIKQNSDNCTVAYSNFTLKQNLNYIFRIKIQSNSYNDNNFILFGLIEDKCKDSSLLQNSGLTYNERGDYFTFNRIIKGNDIPSKKQLNINKQLELRINLQKKMIKLATYPDYDNVSELDDKDKIDPNAQYRFATQLLVQNDKIIIADFLIVDEFDDKMDN